MTFRANTGVGRHGWLRLTPAYGVCLVRDRMASLPPGSRVLDPFSGTGTTALAAAEAGHVGEAVDVNPFLVWLGNVKLGRYSPSLLRDVTDEAAGIVSTASAMAGREGLWRPALHRIDTWWTSGALQALAAIRSLIDERSGETRDLLDVAFCRTLIASSNASFGHQSISFKQPTPGPLGEDSDDYDGVLRMFAVDVGHVMSTAGDDLPGSGRVLLGDSRTVANTVSPADSVITSPPYVNRMSYIRELRPYMYWLRYLDDASDAGDLDWRAIGGTWGKATSRLSSWSPADATPVDGDLGQVCCAIRDDGGKNGALLATYVEKYAHDMWEHFRSVTPVVKEGGTVSYIVGNSTFYGHDVPAQEWYAEMLRALGYRDVTVTTTRKRNSNTSLYEYEVAGARP